MKVPLGKRTTEGCVVEQGIPQTELSSELNNIQIKAVGDEIYPDFQLSSLELELYRWMSRYYHYGLGQLIFDCLPKILKSPRPLKISKGEGENPPSLSSDQQIAFEGISGLKKGKFYLHGVTGSGKTMVYLHLIKKVLREGNSVLFLLPEINLTPQFVKTFIQYLDCPILTYHSGMTTSEKNGVWKYVKNTIDPVVVMGVRSAVFLPVSRLGLIVVDEEHDTSFKQTDRCPFNGRDVAIKKSQLNESMIVLGSATPSMENYYSFKNTSRYFTLKKREGKGSLPKVNILDSTHCFDESLWPLIPGSYRILKESLEKKEQVLVFINRIGYANYIQCRSCGHRFLDPETETNLRYFKRQKILKSAHSDFQIPLPDMCPKCGNMKLLQKGYGTEKIQEVLKNLFPEKKVARFDRDEIRSFKRLEKILADFHSGELDILVGTQMLAKGHNFKRVNTVLVLGMDQQLNFPDFRVLERAYQLLVQITGRAGRFSSHARVLIQTLTGNISLFDYIRSHAFDDFYKNELEMRRSMEMPPFSRITMIHFSSKKREDVVSSSHKARDFLLKIFSSFSGNEVIGPVPSHIEKRKSGFTWWLLVKSRDVLVLNKALDIFGRNFKRGKVAVKIDVDPVFCF